LILFIGCPKDPPNPDPQDTSIFLELEKTWITAVSLKVSVADTSSKWSFNLSRDDSSVGSFIVTGADTVIVDSGLEPDLEYHYRAYWLQDSMARDSSNEVIAVTMDTTSHNFVWEFDSLGNYGSYLRDVAIIDENNIWAVGYLRTDSGRFNSAKWDGNSWKFTQIVNTANLYSILYFSEDDVWVSSGFPKHWDGNDWTMYHLQDMGLDVSVEYLWGNSPSNIYFVGRRGSIVHYDGSTFEEMESGTNVNLTGVVGTADGLHIFAIGRDIFYPAPSVVLEYSEGMWNTLYYTEGTQGDIGAVYGADVLEDTVYITTSEGIWKYNYLSKQSRLIPEDICCKGNDIGATKVMIQSYNDIFFAGAGFKYTHFNGLSYYYSEEITDLFVQRAFRGADYKGRMVVMVGLFDYLDHALVARGYHE